MRFDPPTQAVLGRSQPVSFSGKTYTISELAGEFGLTLRALRFYEDRGLIAPRREGMTRIYSPRERARLAVIVKAKALGFTLSEIKETLAADDHKEDPGSLSLSPAQVDDQIAHLEQQRSEIDEALAELRALQSRLMDACAA